MKGEPTETANLSSWELMDSEPDKSLHGTNPGPLPVCDSCVAWSVCKALSNEIRTCPWYLAGFWEPLPQAGLPSLDAGGGAWSYLMCPALFKPMGGLLLSEWRRRSGC